MLKIFCNNLGLDDFIKIGWKLSLLIGLLILSSYFIDIQFFPTIDFQSIAYLLAIVSVIGIVFFFGIAFLYGFSSYLWMMLLKKKLICNLIFCIDEADIVRNQYKEGRVDLHEKTRLKIVAFGVATMSIMCLFLWLVGTKRPYLFGAVILLGLITKIYLFIDDKESDFVFSNSIMNRAVRSKPFIGAKIFLVSIFPALLLYGTWLIICFLSSDKGALAQFTLMTLLICLSTVCFLPTSKEWEVSKWVACISSSTILFLLLGFGGWGDISTKIVKILGLGSMKNATISMDNIACEDFEKKSFPIKCGFSKSVYTIDNIYVFWRVGECYFQGTNSLGKIRKIRISANHIYDIEPL